MLDILVVEDDPLLCMVLGDELRQAGFRVGEALSGDEALEVLRSDQPRLLIADVDLGPGPSGIDIAAEAMRLNPGIQVIYATARPPAGLGRCMGGRERLVGKPCDFVRIARLARELAG